MDIVEELNLLIHQYKSMYSFYYKDKSYLKRLNKTIYKELRLKYDKYDKENDTCNFKKIYVDGSADIEIFDDNTEYYSKTYYVNGTPVSVESSSYNPGFKISNFKCKEDNVTKEIARSRAGNLSLKLKSMIMKRKRELKVNFILFIILSILLIALCIFAFIFIMPMGIVLGIVLLCLKNTMVDGIKNIHYNLKNAKKYNY